MLQEQRTFIFICDECGAKTKVVDTYAMLPDGWKIESFACFDYSGSGEANVKHICPKCQGKENDQEDTASRGKL